MIIGISQPTFIPWYGYFGLIEYVDEFIFLDHVQFDRRSWQQRNYIKIKDEKRLLTVPVYSKGKFYQKINDVIINKENNYLNNHIKTIEHSYGKSKYFNLYSKDIFDIYKTNNDKLYDLNINLIKYFCKILEINAKFHLSSSYMKKDKNQDLILELCKQHKAQQYISTLGSKEYLKNIAEFEKNRIKVNFFEFRNFEYKQQGKKFIEKLSFLDLIFNLGADSIDYFRSNFYIVE